MSRSAMLSTYRNSFLCVKKYGYLSFARYFFILDYLQGHVHLLYCSCRVLCLLKKTRKPPSSAVPSWDGSCKQ